MINKSGIEWGVMFSNGSVRHSWNGRTERERAAAAADQWAREFYPDRITLAWRLPGGCWHRVENGDAPGSA